MIKETQVSEAMTQLCEHICNLPARIAEDFMTGMCGQFLYEGCLVSLEYDENAPLGGSFTLTSEEFPSVTADIFLCYEDSKNYFYEM